MNKWMKLMGSLISIVLLVLMVSCEKENDNEESTLKTDSKDHALAEQIFDDVKAMADQAYNMGQGTFKSDLNGDRPMLSPCATVTHDTISIPHRIIIDFGPTNCLCNDGKYRRGKIIITYTGRYWHPGTIITHGFEDFYVNDNHVEGTKVVTNEGFNANEKMWWSIVVDGTITKPDGAVFTWVSNREREWIEGRGTPIHMDDVFLLRGSSLGTRPDGSTFSVLVTNDLRKEMSCRWIVSGTVEMTPSNRPTRILDYGDGTCDHFATITIGNRTITIVLP